MSSSLLLRILAIVVISGLTAYIGYNSKMRPHEDKNTRSAVTEYFLTDFGYPHPYRLQFVAQYRFVHQVGEFLVRRNNLQQIVGGLAESWFIATDRHSITFRLRPNLYSADEVAQSLRRLIRSGQTTHSNLQSQLDLESIAALDPLTLTLRTKGDAGAILSPLFMADAVILPDDHWIQVPGVREPQVDWTKTRGPYIYKTGRFPLDEGEELTFIPNPNHYLYQRDELDWHMRYMPPNKIQSFSDLKSLFTSSVPAFATIRYWDRNRIFNEQDPSVPFYETKANGIAYILPNQRNGVFANPSARKTLLKRLFHTNIPLLNPAQRAYQIVQPGLSGRMPDTEAKEVFDRIEDSPDFHFAEPIRWAIPAGAQDNTTWMKSIVESIGLPSTSATATVYPSSKEWKNGDFDATFLGVGMSDTDPISGATFLFSPVGSDADLPDGSLLGLLNSAKNTTDAFEITRVVRAAFKKALENATIVPIHYLVNRHYHSPNVELNIQDPFSESTQIWEIRIKGI